MSNKAAGSAASSLQELFSPRSVKPPFCGLYSCVPLMMTVCAGRLTPQASVAVQHSTCSDMARGAGRGKAQQSGHCWLLLRAARVRLAAENLRTRGKLPAAIAPFPFTGRLP